MNRLIIILFFIFFHSVVFAQYNITDENNALNKKEATLLKRVIDYQLNFYNKIRPDKPIPATEVSLNIYTDYAAYLMYQKENRGRTSHMSMGFYSSKRKEAVVCKDKQEKRFLETCYHELSHFFVNSYFGNVPIWLNEGLAVYFQHLKISSDKIKPEHYSRMFTRVKTMIDVREIDIKDFIGWDTKKFQKMSATHDSYGYALGYTMVEYLMQKDENQVIGLIRLINDGKNSFEAIDSVYDGGFSNFENDFLKYIKNKK